jgi:mannosyltransferase OCH1-like enzyme
MRIYMNVVKNMTHIWVGPKQTPSKWMNTWKDKHPEWNYSVFTDQMLKEQLNSFKNKHLIEEYYRRGRFNGVADLVRYELLYRDGGFLPPADAICLHNTDELFTAPEHFCYTVYESEQFRPGFTSPIMACNPGNQFVKILIDSLHLLQPSQLCNMVWKSTGNEWLSKMIPKHNPDIIIWPSYTLIPKHYERKSIRYSGPDKIYAEQLWGSTSGGADYANGV